MGDVGLGEGRQEIGGGERGVGRKDTYGAGVVVGRQRDRIVCPHGVGLTGTLLVLELLQSAGGRLWTRRQATRSGRAPAGEFHVVVAQPPSSLRGRAGAAVLSHLPRKKWQRFEGPLFIRAQGKD